MGFQDAPGGGRSLASVGFAGAGVGTGSGGGGGGYKDLLVMALPKDDGAKAVEVVAAGLPDVGEAVRAFFRSREIREFASGALAGAMSKAVLAPLETIRTRMVVGVGSRHIGGSFVEIMEQNGWPGLWVGNTINMIRIIPTQAIELGTFEYVKRGMKSAQGKWKEEGCPKIQLGNMKSSCHSTCYLQLLLPVRLLG
ncbi:hypothetical protein ACQ4PT_040602 [Festuca glaucescens]